MWIAPELEVGIPLTRESRVLSVAQVQARAAYNPSSISVEWGFHVRSMCGRVQPLGLQQDNCLQVAVLRRSTRRRRVREYSPPHRPPVVSISVHWRPETRRCLRSRSVTP